VFSNLLAFNFSFKDKWILQRTLLYIILPGRLNICSIMKYGLAWAVQKGPGENVKAVCAASSNLS
jgi:hypothetical protein